MANTMKLVVALMLLSLAGCSLIEAYCKSNYPTVITKVQTVEVKVPVTAKTGTSPDDMLLPDLPVSNLKAGDLNDVVAKEYRTTIDILKTEVLKLRNELNAYKDNK